MYEIAWTRRLALVFGNSSLATSTALVAFIGGLALGARLFASKTDAALRPLRTYAILEILIGVFGIASPWVLDGVQELYLRTWPEATAAGLPFILYRFALVAATLVIPTALMGATVPMLTQVFRFRRALAGSGASAFGLPLGANTAGALAGTLLAGFVLLPRLGLRGTLLLAGASNVVLGLMALSISRSQAFRRIQVQVPSDEPGRKREKFDAETQRRHRVALAIAAVAGACGLGLEIAWTRLLALVLGSTAYAFTLMLSAYLLGLAIGTLVFARLASVVSSPARALAWCLLVFAGSTWAGLYYANDLPFWFLDLFRRLGDKPSDVFLAQGVLAAGMMTVPALASGAILPLVMRVRIPTGTAGATGGRIYAVNTAAGIFAVIVVTFLLIPQISLRTTMMAVVVVLAAAAVLALWAAEGGRGRKAVPAALALALAGAVAVLTPAFSPTLFATAVYRYADRYKAMSRAEFEAVRNPDSSPVLYDADGFVARVTVLGPRDDPTLLLDGKGASAGGDVPTEILLAQLPILFAERPQSVLVIGHGAGVTTGSALANEAVKEVVSIEIEGKVLECAPLFEGLNGGFAADARLRLVENDGRNFLLATSAKFDVICSQPSNPWVSGAAPLFCAEAYRAGARCLNPGGVFCQWLQTYEMSEDNLQVLVRTFAREFPHVALLTSTVRGHVFLLGSGHEIKLDRSDFDDIGRGALGVQMRRALVEAPASLLALFCFRDAELRAWAGDGVLNTDDNSFIEFALPFDIFASRVDAIHASLSRSTRGLGAFVSFPPGTSADAIGNDWANWAVALRSMKKDELYREAAEEARKH